MLYSKRFKHPPSNSYSVQVQPTIELPKKPKTNTCSTVESIISSSAKVLALKYVSWSMSERSTSQHHPSNLICDRAVVFYQLCCCLASHHRCVTTASVLLFICTVVSSSARWSLSCLYSSDTHSYTIGCSLVAPSLIMTSLWPVSLGELSPASCLLVHGTVLSTIPSLCIAFNNFGQIQ